MRHMDLDSVREALEEVHEAVVGDGYYHHNPVLAINGDRMSVASGLHEHEDFIGIDIAENYISDVDDAHEYTLDDARHFLSICELEDQNDNI